MASSSPSPYTRPIDGLRIKEGVPPIQRPTKEEVAAFPEEARRLLDENWAEQEPLVTQGSHALGWMEDAHLLLAGATGPGLGGALASAALHLIGKRGSLTVIGRDLSRSVGYEMGQAMQARAEQLGFGERFHWLNSGLGLDGKELDAIVAALQEAGADRVVYINTVAAANSGTLPGHPPVYVTDMDEEGLFQWQIPPLDERAIEATKFIMGTMAVEFPGALAAQGIDVALTAFADWRGSLDHISRDPANPEYGRQGTYSTSLYLPKDIIQEATAAAYGTDQRVIDIFLPIMRTRALSFIPGGVFMSRVYDTLMAREGIRRIDIPELAIGMLDRIGQALSGNDNPFPRLDAHEAPLDLWFFEVARRLNNDESSPFFYKKWLARGA